MAETIPHEMVGSQVVATRSGLMSDLLREEFRALDVD
jgi:hypothetical protein